VFMLCHGPWPVAWSWAWIWSKKVQHL